MKYLIVFAFLILFGCTETPQQESLTKQKEQRLLMAEMSYATGCYQGYMRSCSFAVSEDSRNACLQDGVNVCEKAAANFRIWLENKK